MKFKPPARPFAAFLMAFMLLAAPVGVLAKKGEKNYNRGMEYEKAQQWEKAAQEFALAVAAAPNDTEYQLHYRRAVFNASQNYMTKGRALADQGDYIGAYNAYRQAYGLDPVNDLAAQEMDRVLRLQREKEGKDNPRTTQTNYRGPAGTVPVPEAPAANGTELPGRSEQLQTVQYNGDLEGLIRKLADEMSLNVVFDQAFSQVKRQVNIRWKDITPARALDYVFLANGLFFQKLDRRTILVADQSKRPMYQQLVLRTFYLYNIKPSEARTLLTGALPANAGRQPQFIENATTNSITVRDTPENMRTIEKLLQSVDKDRAEVVMEVSIYEISRNDLLQIGNQVGTIASDTQPSNLQNFGGVQGASVVLGRAGALAAAPLLHTGVGLLIPASALSLYQSRGNTRLLFSTQVHAFDDEKSSTRVGSKVPVQTASVYNGLVAQQPGTGTGTGLGNALGRRLPRHPVRGRRPQPRLQAQGLPEPGRAGLDDHRVEGRAGRRQPAHARLHAAQDRGRGAHPEREDDDDRLRRAEPRAERPRRAPAPQRDPAPRPALQRAEQEQPAERHRHHDDAARAARAGDHAAGP